MMAVDSLDRARRHAVTHDGPAVRFMSGAVLGNGGLGVVATTRPDAVVLHLGHNEVWDERFADVSESRDVDFPDAFARISEAAARGPVTDDPWAADYIARMQAPYNRPYPRPYPCGSVVLGLDPRRTEVLGHCLDLATGECRVTLRDEGQLRYLEILVDQETDHVLLRVIDEDGAEQPAPFTRLRLLPDPLGPLEEGFAVSAAEQAIAATETGEVGVRETVTEVASGPGAIVAVEDLPAASERPEDAHRSVVGVFTDRALIPYVHPAWSGGMAAPVPLERALEPGLPLSAVIEVRHERGAAALAATVSAPAIDAAEARRRSRTSWTDYWQHSGIALDDVALERAWYRNTYFTHCCLRSGRQAPGLFGPWSLGEVGTAWHGDYHFNYNTQQLYWGVFSSNRVASHEPYVDLVEQLLPQARDSAQNYWRLPGAAFPHSGFPVPMPVLPFPTPVWGWEMCETPWVVQSLWWHYRYTLDEEFLRRRALPVMRAAAEFVIAYLNRPEAAGDDGRLHIFPTVVPEVFGLTPQLELNRDSLADLTLIRFLLRAYLDATTVTGEREDDGLRNAASDALGRLADYPTAQTPEGEVFVAAPGADPEVVCNIPLAGMTVFPGEEHSWQSAPEDVARARRSIRQQRLEGGNELVFVHLQAARLGMLDLDRFKRQLAYCELPNGALADMVIQVHGRYSDATPFDFMADMGIFVENFGVTAVINELLLQSSTGTLRVFPNSQSLPGRAAFRTLRAMGAFLVSAEARDGVPERIEVTSERGAPLRLLLPWDARVDSSRTGATQAAAGIVEIGTAAGETLTFTPAHL